MRFGRDIQLDKFQTSDTIKIICVVISIIIIPLELFVESYLTDVERPMIEGLQKAFGENEWLLEIFEIPLYLVKPDATMIFM
jgi:hypothetical protein